MDGSILAFEASDGQRDVDDLGRERVQRGQDGF